jgi:hypothetical protein
VRSLNCTRAFAQGRYSCGVLITKFALRGNFQRPTHSKPFVRYHPGFLVQPRTERELDDVLHLPLRDPCQVPFGAYDTLPTVQGQGGLHGVVKSRGLLGQHILVTFDHPMLGAATRIAGERGSVCIPISYQSLVPTTDGTMGPDALSRSLIYM